MNLEELNPKNRFSSRAQNYAQYRPGYSNEIIGYLQEVIELSKNSVIADIGSGTGICTKIFLDNGNTVYAVEPNQNMRQAAESLRILKPNGVVVLLWNIRSAKPNAFMQEYLELIRRYEECYTNKHNDEDIIPKFFDYRTVNKKVFHNPQVADFARLKGELASFSYMPNESDANFQPMISKLQDLFNKHSDNGNVVLEYETHLYYCKVK